jgi:hypothetical protein
LNTRIAVLTGLLAAGSLQASIIQSGTGLTFTSGLYSQDFSSPSSNPGMPGSLGNSGTGNTTVTFTGLTLSSSTSSTLYYDPNGDPTSSTTVTGANIAPVKLCSQSNLPFSGSGLVPISGGCIGTYKVDSTNTTNEGHAYAPLLNQTPNITIGFAAPVYGASFVFGIPGAGAGVNVFNVVLKNNGVIVDTFSGVGNLNNQALNWLDISNEGAFNTISITQIAGVYAGNGNTFNAVIGNLSATTSVPEPGTIGLLGLGLAGVGYFARRRKA